MLTYFATIQGEMAEIGALGKTLIAFERNKLGRSALRRWTENIFFYRIVKVQWKIFSEYRAQAHLIGQLLTNQILIYFYA